MRSGFFILLSGILFLLLTDTLLFIQLKSLLRKKKWFFLYWGLTLLFLTGFVAYHFTIRQFRQPEMYYWINLAIACFFIFYVPKVLFVCVNALDRGIRTVFHRKKRNNLLPGACIAVFFFLLFLYSFTIGKSDYKVKTTTISLPTLPESFEQLKIVHLSDLHLGSLSPTTGSISKLVELVNRQQPDLILFTGDMVNNLADEMKPWILTLAELHAKHGKYAVMGNHDYGDYSHWSDPQEKEDNFNRFQVYMKDMGFQLLNNTAVPFIMESDTLMICGVENWGKPPFPMYGDLNAALQQCEGKFTLLLSHDPSHWRSEVIGKDIPLTLSGHTHAMQMGIEIGRFKWSPARYIYPEYDGLYRQQNQYLHVNRGVGFLGLPGRIGMRPQVDVLILK